jgi:hypothetical protein
MATGGLANIESVKAGRAGDGPLPQVDRLQVQFVNASIRAQRYLLTLGRRPRSSAHRAARGAGPGRRDDHGRKPSAWATSVAFQVLLAGFAAPVHALFSHTQKLQTLRGDLARLDDVLHHCAEEGHRRPPRRTSRFLARPSQGNVDSATDLG